MLDTKLFVISLTIICFCPFISAITRTLDDVTEEHFVIKYALVALSALPRYLACVTSFVAWRTMMMISKVDVSYLLSWQWCASRERERERERRGVD